MKVYFKGWLTVLALVLAALVMIILATQPTRAAGPWYVAPGGDDGNDCLNSGPAHACATINGALNKAGFAAGDTILVATGVYTGTGSEVVLLDKNATLSGGWDASFTTQSGTSTIDGQGVRRGMTVNSGVTAVVERFSVQNGSAGGFGFGGGIYSEGTLTLNSNTVSGNTANYGGGIHNQSSGTVTLNNSTVSGNTASYNGGGIENWGTLNLNNSAISDNMANDVGGGIFNGGTLTLTNSTVSGNTASWDGGIRNYDDGTLILNNSTISGNTARYGGGIGNWGTLNLNNSTVTDNIANDVGGGIRRYSGTVILRNTVLAGNTANSAPDCSGTIGSANYNLIGDTSGCTFSPATDDLTDVSANLGQLIGSPGYHPLLSSSPAIDAGNSAGCTDHLANPLPTDQRGAARVGRCDMGAYEYTIPGPAASIYAFGGTPQTTPPFLGFRAPLQAAVLDSIGSPVDNATVTFSAPASGPSGTFADSGTFTTTAIASESGIATATTFTANGLTGSYTVTATVGGVVTPANFLLSNIGWYVASDGDDSNDCLSPGTACATINGALGKADPSDTMLVASGTYTSTGNEVVLLDKDVTLSGGWNTSFTTQSGTSTIDGEGTRRGITVNSGVTAVVERFSVQNGSAGGFGSGGGIYSEGTLTLNSNTVSGNTANYGGGIHNQSSGTVTLNNSTVSGNTASYNGGGIRNADGTLTLNNSTVSDNTAGSDGGGIDNSNGTLVLNNSIVSGNTVGSGRSGGGIYNWGISTLTLNNSTVSGNTAGGSGGGISGGTVILNNSTVSGNTASQWGGGIIGDGLTLNNSTVSGNTASEKGGGIYKKTSYSAMTLNNSTVSGNTASAEGGGIYVYGGTVTLQNTILADNTAGSGSDCSGPGTIGSAGYNLIGDTSGCTFVPGTDELTDIDAKLGVLGGSPGYHPLLPGSPAINAGNPTGCMGSTGLLTTDQRGFPRFGRCDIGAYEMQPIGFSTKTVNPSTVLPSDPLTYTIALNNAGATDITNVWVTDALPVFLSYISNSLTATSGSYGYTNSVITWTGSVNAGGAVTITFGATVSQTAPPGTSITNSAVISGGGEMITRTATVAVEPQRIYLPIIARNYCPDFFDDFSNPASGWDVVDVSSVRTEYWNGEYRILTKRAGYIYVFQAPTCDRRNYVVEADARWVGTPGQSYGLGFGITADFSQYYVFDINTDYREFRLRRRDAGGFTTIVPSTYSAAINGGTASNHLKVTRNGDQITLEVNGTVLGTWTDGTITGLTGAGVVSSSYSTNPTSDARFDNFSVVSLPGSGAAAQELGGAGAEVGDLQISGAHRALADIDQWPRRGNVEPEIK